MSTEQQPGSPTLHDTEGGEAVRADEALLVYVGSPEDGFEGAGSVFALSGVRSVSFERATEGKFSVEMVGSELRVAIGLPWVSGQHARIEIDDAHRLQLSDCGSRNGTFFEGSRITDAVQIEIGDIFEVGRSFWSVLEGRPPRFDRRGLDPTGTAHPHMASLCRALDKVAESNVPVLLIGETGTGKGYLARAIHRRAGRPGPFVRANVVAGSMERALMGDAVHEEAGLLASARGGTLFLDDVGELSLERQTKLLSALMAHIPARAKAPMQPDEVRIVAASTRDLRHMVATEEFRPDLYARLAGFEARIPPLRERREDLGLFVRRFARRPDGEPVAIACDVFREMLGHDWPFNVRELVHALEAGVALTDAGATLDVSIWDRVAWRADVPSPARIQAVRTELMHQLAAHEGDTSAVADSLKCGVEDVQRWLTRLSLHPDQFV